MAEPVAKIDPPEQWVYPGGGWMFQLLIDGAPDAGATWSISSPAVGTINGAGELRAFEEYVASWSTITATPSDPKIKPATATVRVLVPAPYNLGAKPALIDDFSIPGVIESVPWNDDHGARAALIIYDVLNQLPKEFLDAAGDVSIIRAKTLPGNHPPKFLVAGQHLPLLDNPVLIADDNLISQLVLDPRITNADFALARTLVHEMSHAIMTRRALSELDRLAVLVGMPALVAWNPTLFLVPPAYLYARYFSPFAVEDFCSEYAKVAGWVINNTNPFSFLWNDTTKVPNAVTGWGLLGKTVHLRNIHRAGIPITIPTDTAEDTRQFQQRGFPSIYGATDLHEDWAESLMTVAFQLPAAAMTAFDPRRQFIFKAGVWPRRNAPVIVTGRTYLEGAVANGKPPPDMTGFRVDFGFYSGKPRPSDKVAMRRMPGVERDDDAADPAAAAGEASMGEGRAQPDEMADDYREVLKSQLSVVQAVSGQDDMQEAFDAAFAPTRDALSAVALDAPSGSLMELLRTAERHGTGLSKVVATLDGQTLSIAGAAVRSGDLLFGSDGTCMAVSAVGEDGGITRIVVLPAIAGEGEQARVDLQKSLAPDHVVLHWSPSHEPRVWAAKDAPRGDYPDLDAALSGMIELWGAVEGGREKDLSAAGNFVALVVTWLGVKASALIDADADAVHDFLDGFGAGVRALPKAAPFDLAAGDLVRLRKGGLWGLCTSVSEDGASVDVLVQGGAKGLVGEPENAVTLQKGLAATDLSQSWRGSAAKRDR